MLTPRHPPGCGWLVLLGGGEFSFGDTLEADRAWLEKTDPGPIAFLPTASGSKDYGSEFTRYLQQTFDRQASIVPIYRRRDAQRQKNCQLLEDAAAVYLGGGVADDLVEVLSGSLAAEALERRLSGGGVVVATAAAAQATGCYYRPLRGGEASRGLGWLDQGVLEANFDPAHDRRLRALLESPSVTWGLGLPAASAALLGPENTVEYVGPTFGISNPDGDWELLG